MMNLKLRLKSYKPSFYIFYFIIFQFFTISRVFSFTEINPNHTSQEFQNLIYSTLNYLNDKNNIGKLTAKSIINENVQIDEFSDFTLEDYKKVVFDFKDDSNFKFTTLDYEQLTISNSKLIQFLNKNLDGFMVESRVYFSFELSLSQLASTLVHEINHVLNCSDLHYYESSKQGFMEEYRAFYVQKWFEQNSKPTKKQRENLQNKVIETYQFPKDIANFDLPKGLFVPSLENWKTECK